MNQYNDRTWNQLTVAISVILLVIYIGVGVTRPLMEAEFIAEKLAPRIGGNEDYLRNHLSDILQYHHVRRTIIQSMPMAAMCAILLARFLLDKKRRAEGGMDRKVEKGGRLK